jgi:hypothetical protein
MLKQKLPKATSPRQKRRNARKRANQSLNNKLYSRHLRLLARFPSRDRQGAVVQVN